MCPGLRVSLLLGIPPHTPPPVGVLETAPPQRFNGTKGTRCAVLMNWGQGQLVCTFTWSA